ARLVPNVGRREPHPTAALRAQWPRVRLESVLLRERGSVVGHRERQEMKLDVGVGHAHAASDEAAGLEMIGCAEPVLEEEPSRADDRPGKEAHRRIERDWLGAGDLEIELEVILQVL